MFWFAWTTLRFLGDFFQKYVGDQILNSVALNSPPGRPGADMRKNSMRRLDFPTHPIHAPACVDDGAVCKRFFRKFKLLL